jgi:predicted SAM-dependent methyltransferase
MSFASAANDQVVSFFAFIRKGRVVDTARYPLVKVNLGSGLCVADGWINLDVSLPSLMARWPNFMRRMVYRMMPSTSGARRYNSEREFCDILRRADFVHHNASYGLPFRDRTVDFIYTSHFVEHLFLSDTRRLLKECRRVFRPGGIIRIVIPDLSYVMALFNRGEKERALSYFFYDRGPSYFTRHKYMYDFDLLKNELRTAGFVDVRQCPFRGGAVPDLETLDCREDESLHVEATSPGG